jgi:hypothetical protein
VSNPLNGRVSKFGVGAMGGEKPTPPPTPPTSPR